MTNAERAHLAAELRWQFRPNAPDLLERWTVVPFNQRGDKRIAFGVITGGFRGLPFTMFDFHRRPKVTAVHRGTKVSETDTITVDSVWVIALPAPMPYFSIVSDVFDTAAYPEPTTRDRKFNRGHKLIATDPDLAVQVLTPKIMSTMRRLKLHTWALVGNELIYAHHPTFTRTKPDGIITTLGNLATLVSHLPLHLGHPAPPPPHQHQWPRYEPQPTPPRY
jgi:hypothetical protein